MTNHTSRSHSLSHSQTSRRWELPDTDSSTHQDKTIPMSRRDCGYAREYVNDTYCSEERYQLSAYQRFVLSCLAANGGTASIVTLARDVLRKTAGPESVTTRSVRETYLSLHSQIVTDLMDQNLVEYSDTDGTVRLTR